MGGGGWQRLQVIDPDSVLGVYPLLCEWITKLELNGTQIILVHNSHIRVLLFIAPQTGIMASMACTMEIPWKI